MNIKNPQLQFVEGLRLNRDKHHAIRPNIAAPM